ncbi:hypothetical protein ACPV5L_07400 [Vibrio astriarenae]
MKVKLGFKSSQALINSLLVTKFFYLFFAVFVYSKLTTLGDSERYLSSGFYVGFSSTAIMDVSGFFFGKIPQPFSHIPLLLLSYFGLAYLVRTMDYYGICNSYKRRFIFFFVMSIPSVGVWTSIHSKESVGIFFMSVISSYFIRVYCQGLTKIKLLELVAVILCVIFKPQYMIALFSIYLVLVLRSRRVSSYTMALFFLLVLSSQICILYYFSPLIDTLSYAMHSHFDTGSAQSTRDNIFFSSGDFFRHAPYGILISMIGPTLPESIENPFKMIVFLESFFFLLTIICFFFIAMSKSLVLRFNIVAFSLFFLMIFWIGIVHYPFGVFNAGSAIRYRSNFIPFFLAFSLLLSRSNCQIKFRL